DAAAVGVQWRAGADDAVDVEALRLRIFLHWASRGVRAGAGMRAGRRAALALRAGAPCAAIPSFTNARNAAFSAASSSSSRGPAARGAADMGMAPIAFA